MKRIIVILIALIALSSAAVANAAPSSSTPSKNPPAAQNAYPLTITVQPPLKGGGVNVPYVITVSYPNPTKTPVSKNLPRPALHAYVLLDYAAKPAAGNPHLVYVDDEMSKLPRLAWDVGTIALGETKSITLWYQPTVTFPDYTDPFTGTVYPGQTFTLGYDYQPWFTLFDTKYKLYTSAVPAMPPFLGGK